MNFRTPLLSLFVATALLVPRSYAAEYTLDNSHTAVIFSIAHMGFSYTYGRFNKVTGDFSFDSADPIQSQFEFTITTESVDSNDAKRDEHLRGPDFFNAKQFPEIKFVSSSVAPGAEGMIQVTGNLTMHRETKEVILPMKLLGEGPGPMGDNRVGFFLETSLKRSDYGMSGMLKMIGDEVGITISFEGVQK